MATQIKKKFIGNDQVDGDKILLQEGQDLRRIVSGSPVNVIADLQGQIDSEEARALAAEAALQSEVDAVEAGLAQEISDRQAADVALDARIDALEVESGTWHKKKVDLVAADITNGYVDLDHIVIPGSVSAFVDRLAIHEGAAEDYVLSTEGGVTRVTFVNELVSPGSQSLDDGDTLYFKYQF